MNQKINIAMATLAGLALVSVFHSSYTAVGAQAGRSVVDGVFTEAQAKRGEKVYAENCSVCHSEDLKGSDVIPTLASDEFLKAWATIDDLFEKISVTMPATAPGSLTPEQSADAVAYVLSVSKYPTGANELAPKRDDLKQIRMELPKR